VSESLSLGRLRRDFGAEAGCRNGLFDVLRHLDRDAVLLQPPEKADDEIATIADERRLLSFEHVADELERPANAEHRHGEREAHDRDAYRQARGNERNADFVTSLICRVLVVRVVVLHQLRPLSVQANHDDHIMRGIARIRYSRSNRGSMAKTARAAPRKKPRQERSQQMVETLVEAAARVFVKEGYAKATTNRIAEAAGVSVGSLYQYFPSKDAIAVELLRRYREGLVALISDRLPLATRETFAEVVRDLLRDLLRAEGINPALHRVLIEQVLRTSARKEMLGFEERLEEVIRSALRNAGVLDEDHHDLVSFILVRVVLSVVQSVVVDRPKLNGPVLVDELTRLVVGYVGFPVADRRTTSATNATSKRR
jgi:AcrR family transcriptional regulator